MKKILYAMIFLLAACTARETSETENMNENAIEELPSAPRGFYIGTYTSGSSEGIYYAVFDPATGGFSELRLAARATNPSFLALSADKMNLYGVMEEENSSIVAYNINGPGSLAAIDTVSSQGAYACYVATDQAGQYVLAANYGTGNVISVPISASAGFTDLSDVKQHEGTGPVAARQEGPHAHSIVLDPSQRFALAADLGADRIMVYEVGPQGQLVENSPAYIETAPGAGPRHIAFHPNGNWVYVINELNNTITAYDYNLDAGILTEKQVISTLPEGFTGESYCADIHVHPNGRFLYGSNRGHDSIVTFIIDDDGNLSLSGHYRERVKWPRNFAISPDAGYLIIGNERDNSIISAKIDPESGMPSFTGNALEVGSPVCIVFDEEM